MRKQTPANLPQSAQVVIIGGGIIGCSIAYHLTKLGLTDVVLLERKKLTSGTTWHSAGQIGQLRPSYNLTKLSQYTADLLPALEKETGQATGFTRVGSVGFASTPGRLEELKRVVSMAKSVGVEAEFVTQNDIKDLWPLINPDGILGGVYTPGDGYTSPVDTTVALAKGAKMRGAKIFEDVKVTDIFKNNNRITGVMTEFGPIDAEIVVNCGGMWAREIGKMAGATVPVQACEHFYMVTETDDRFAQSPSLRDWDAHVYYKNEPGKLLFGCFEHKAKPWATDGIPEDFCFDELPEDLEHFMPYLEAAMHRVPLLRDVGIRTFFNGPESFTPDVRYLLGETAEVKNFFVACGFNSIGILSSGGAGKALAEWIVAGEPTMDLSDVDIRRMSPFQNNTAYIVDRATESLGLLYATHWPYRQPESARGVRRSAFHHILQAHGACFGEMSGWERPNWFAPKGSKPAYEYSFGRQNWFDHSRAEHMAIRQGVGILDLSSFAKFLVQGRDAEHVLQRICAADVAVPTGKVVYTQWLNANGGIVADLTVTRRADDEFLVITGGSSAVRDLAWLREHIPGNAHCTVTVVTSGYASLGVMGPSARDLLSALSSADLSNDSFPFGTAQEVDLGYASALALRVSYVGELGWELHIPTEFAQSALEELLKQGLPLGAKLVGMHAMDSCRIEKAYRHWGHDITGEDTPVEAGLLFACCPDKPVEFIGQAALQKQREQGARKRLVQFALDDPAPLLYHHEPIFRNDKLVGYISSGAYGHYLGRAIGLGYAHLPDDEMSAAEFVQSGAFEIEVACEKISAQASLRPMYDPKNERLRL